jgi:protein-S-isoprenylcysteine O-methyltransferase Ste14
MSLAPRLIGFLWLACLAYWLISAVRAKKEVKRNYGRFLGLRVAIFLLVFGVFQLERLHEFLHFSQRLQASPWQPVLAWTGVALCGAGLAFAIAARRHIGKNWGMPMTLQQGHELVTSGPYSLVRHPIYSGFLLALLGTAFTLGPAWLLLFAVICFYFGYSARFEERLMERQFPGEYPAYRKKTRMLVPFVW